MSKVTVTGRGFRPLNDRIEEKVDTVLRKGAFMLQRAATMEIVANAFDTGNLASSVSWAKLGVMNYQVYTNVDYAGYVHDGTEKMGARPFFVWASDSEFPKIERAIDMVIAGTSV